MLQKIRITVLLIMLTGSVLRLFAQSNPAPDPYRIMNKLFNQHYNKGNCTYSGVINLFDENGDKSLLIEQKKFEYILFNQKIDYRIGNIQIINRSPKYYLLADHDQKYVAYVSKNVGDQNVFQFSPEIFKQLMQSSKGTVEISGQKENMQIMVDDIQGSNINSYTIFYNGLTNIIQKIDMYIWSFSPLAENKMNHERLDAYLYRLEINYSKHDKLALPYSPENKLLSFNGKDISLKQAYKDYTFINQSE